MRMPEMPLEPMVRAVEDAGPYEDEDRIHELVRRANEIRDRKHKPQFVGPSAELMPDSLSEEVTNAERKD